MICPNCNGDGYNTGFIRRDVRIECDICKGKKVLPQWTVYDPARGEQLKQGRLEEGLTLKRYCQAFKVSVTERSKQERGYFNMNEATP